MSATPSQIVSSQAALPDEPASRRRLPSEDRRRQLIDQAVKLVSQRGFSGTRTKDIAAACGVSEAILFRHFATKEDLYRAILESHADEAGSREWMLEMKRLASERKDRELVHTLASRLVRSFRENSAFHRLMLYAWLEGHAMADMAHQQLGQPMFDFLKKYVTQRQREGAFVPGDPAAIVVALYAPAFQFAMAKYVLRKHTCKQDDQSMVEQFTEISLAGIRAPRNRVSQKSGPKVKATKRSSS